MSSLPRRALLSGSLIGVTSIALPSAAAAASDDRNDPSPTVSFDPAVDFVNLSPTPGAEGVQVDVAWAEGYTRFSFGRNALSGTTGTEEPFAWTLTGTDVDGEPVFSSGTNSGGVTNVTQSAKPGTTVTLQLTSSTYPSDVRTFTHTR